MCVHVSSTSYEIVPTLRNSCLGTRALGRRRLRFLALMIASTSSGVMSVGARSPHAVTKAARNTRSTALPLRSLRTLSKPGLGDGAEVGLIAQCLDASGFGSSFSLDDRGIDAFADQALPATGGIARLLQAHAGIVSDHTPRRRCAGREPPIQDEGDLARLAAPLRVRVLAV